MDELQTFSPFILEYSSTPILQCSNFLGFPSTSQDMFILVFYHSCS